MIQHCFHYTGTVLTSTLAFQKEQKLKCECQVSVCLPGVFLGTSSSPRRLSCLPACVFLRTSSSPRRLSTRALRACVIWANGSIALVQLGNLVTWKSLKEEGRSSLGSRHCLGLPSSV